MRNIFCATLICLQIHTAANEVKSSWMDYAKFTAKIIVYGGAIYTGATFLYPIIMGSTPAAIASADAAAKAAAAKGILAKATATAGSKTAACLSIGQMAPAKASVEATAALIELMHASAAAEATAAAATAAKVASVKSAVAGIANAAVATGAPIIEGYFQRQTGAEEERTKNAPALELVDTLLYDQAMAELYDQDSEASS